LACAIFLTAPLSASLHAPETVRDLEVGTGGEEGQRRITRYNFGRFQVTSAQGGSQISLGADDRPSVYECVAERRRATRERGHDACAVALLVVVLALVDVFRAESEHAVDQACEFVRAGGDGFGGPEAGLE